jgi:Zn-finger protein
MIKTNRERHTPLNPPSMGEYIEQFPSVEGCRFHGRECAFIFFPVYPEKRIKKHK